MESGESGTVYNDICENSAHSFLGMYPPPPPDLKDTANWEIFVVSPRYEN